MLFSFPAYQSLASALQDDNLLRLSPFSIARYDNQEMHAVMPGQLQGARCFILGSIAPPDERLISFTLLAHTLREHGAAQINGILPYLAYTRQDKVKQGESLATAWVGSLLQASRVDRILTVDIHSDRDLTLLQIPVISLSTASLFAKEIHIRGLTDATIVAPDHGAVRRCQAVKSALGLPASDTPYFEKKRTGQGVVHTALVGTTCAKVILVDDMLDTGGTLVSACEHLISNGVSEIYIFVTHGLFTGEAWQKLWSLRVRLIFCTDTVQPPPPALGNDNISVLSVAPLLQEELARLNTSCFALQGASGNTLANS
jgi:ribose-phosphate pyrophosphokinase